MSDLAALKDLYKDYFKIGVAGERVSERFTNNEIGNPHKEAMILKQFNSFTFANELKPMYNMAFHSQAAAEDFLPFELNPNAKFMLDFAKANGLKVRGHVMVWHSQCPKEIFCKGYSPVTIPTDPELLKENPRLKYFEKLDPVCYVTRDILLKRLKSYIFNLVEWMYKDGYADTIYAWDVVNEAIEPADKKESCVRKSYWSEIIGDDYIYWSFRFAYDAVEKFSKEYNGPKPILFYNDYNEFDSVKKEAIIKNLNAETDEHGSIISEGLLGGIGMQGHLSDNNNIDEYISALMDYSKLANVVHITELDVKCTCTNINAEYYQAVFYREFFKALVKAKEAGAGLECVTFWGLTDDNSWIRGANPLLFHGDLTPKKAYYGLCYALSGESLGEPERIEIDLSDKFFDFEKTTDEEFDYKAAGFKSRGWGEIALCDSMAHSGSRCLFTNRRFGAWSGISLDVSDFIGQTVKVSAWVYSPAIAVNLNAELAGSGDRNSFIASADTNGNWSYIEGEYEIPSNLHSMFLYFDTKEENPEAVNPVYIDEVSVKLIGQKESFEHRDNIASIRGMGHLPVLMVTDKESVDKKSRSLLVSRAEKDATVKFDISSYIGRSITLSLYVKTKDSLIRVGLDGNVPVVFTEVKSDTGFTHIVTNCDIPAGLNSAEFFVETNGNADMFIDDILVTLA
ncbi:MAG: endo-1,4-beta-xylanase [Lachnospiraceae bacterium]|nr:endo-1,4-beta-xylanase [Lachnospiraceae bacterium]